MLRSTIAILLALLCFAGTAEAQTSATNRELRQALTANGRFGVPGWATASLPTCNAGNERGVAYDLTTDTFKVCNGTAWVEPSAGTITSGTTLVSGATDTRVCFADGGTPVLNCGDAGLTFAKTTDTLTVVGPGIFGNGSTVAKGTGSAVATLGGVLNVNTTSQATTGTVEEVLATYTLPANTLSANGKGLRITMRGTMVSTTNSRVFRIRFGGIGGTIVGLVSSTTAAHTQARIVVEIIRTGSATQITTGTSTYGANSGAAVASVTNTAPTQDLTAAVDIVVVGETSAALGDVTFTALIVEAIN
jgi:hypothetical protein